MDLNMPGMSGIELCEAIRNTCKMAILPIVLMSGNDSDESLVTGLTAGANDFVGKPFKRSVLLAKVESLLKTRSELVPAESREPSREALRRKSEVAVTFVDLRGFTAFSESFGLDAVTEVLDAYYMEIGQEARRWNGTIGGLAGDGVLVFFNLEQSESSSIESAIQFGLGTRRRLTRLQKEWNQKGYELGFGIGIARGESQIGQIGIEDYKEFTVIGSVPNLAARLSSAAGASQILISAETADTFGLRIAGEPLGPVALKGIKRRLEVCNVLGLNAA
jgi:class 3 adenylate cyclase